MLSWPLNECSLSHRNDIRQDVQSVSKILTKNCPR